MVSEITIEKCAEELGMMVGELRYLFENVQWETETENENTSEIDIDMCKQA